MPKIRLIFYSNNPNKHCFLPVLTLATLQRIQISVRLLLHTSLPLFFYTRKLDANANNIFRRFARIRTVVPGGSADELSVYFPETDAQFVEHAKKDQESDVGGVAGSSGVG